MLPEQSHNGLSALISFDIHLEGICPGAAGHLDRYRAGAVSRECSVGVIKGDNVRIPANRRKLAFVDIYRICPLGVSELRVITPGNPCAECDFFEIRIRSGENK